MHSGKPKPAHENPATPVLWPDRGRWRIRNGGSPESLKHGQWMPWCKENLRFDVRTVQRYMQLASKNDIVSYLDNPTEAYRLLANPDGQDKAERKAGELLAGMEMHNGDPRLHDATRLSDLGIAKHQSSRCQSLADPAAWAKTHL